MNSIYKEIFTDSTKDVIGNDPVLDQFDISYAASLYGSTGDDYVTGSLLSIDTNNPERLVAGDRGSIFSKFYKSGKEGENYIPQAPWISWYQIEWKERFARTSRFLQCFDSSERYYDSCLPNLKNALSIDGTEVWGIDTKSGNFHSVLSPISNFVTASAGYVVFNAIKKDRTSEGFETDPLVNNMWTWSYPFENKYDPNKRYLKFTDTLGIDNTYLYCNWGMSSNGYEWSLDFNNIRRYKPESVYSLSTIYPVLPGRFRENASSLLDAGHRNAMRVSFDADASYKVKIPNLFDVGLDSLTGVSFLLPSDANLLNAINYDDSHLNPTKVSEYGIPIETPLYQSLNLDDSVKFYFGFGDLNNMTYASASIEENALVNYDEGFEKSKQVLFYFWGSEGSGLFGGSENSYSETNCDRALNTLIEDEPPDAAVELSMELSGLESGTWLQFAPPGSSEEIPPCSFWQTKSFDPIGGSYTIPGNVDDGWTIVLNMKATTSGITVKAVAYIIDSSNIPYWTGGYESSSTIQSSWGTLTITVPGVDLAGTVVVPGSRIVVDLQILNPNEECTVYFSPRIDYLDGEEDDTPEVVYSTLLSSIPSDDLTLVLVNNLETFDSGNLRVDWSKSRQSGYNWFVKSKDGDQSLLGEPCSFVGISTSPPEGIFWSNPAGTDNYVLYNVVGAAESVTIAPASVDITSSLPWSLKYERGSLGTDMHVYFSGIPGLTATNDTTVVYDIETAAASEEDYSLLSQFNSVSMAGGNPSNPWIFGPGEYKLCFSVSETASIAVAINNLQITTYNVSYDPFGPKVGGNNYPEFRAYFVNDVENLDTHYDSFTSAERLATKQFYQSHIVSISPIIRGWKYGLVSGLPTNTKAVFRRDKYGQFRDMLEQRQYTKLVSVDDSPVDDEAIVKDGFNSIADSRLSRTITMTQVNDSPVQVGFYRQRYKKDDRGIGYIYKEKVSPELTYSQNLSVEVTSSLPYFDGEAKLRQESNLGLIKDAMITSLQFDPSGFTVI